jgi:3-deoxy-7-phosphoheptulonate synthase
LLRSAQLILDNGNPNVILCERGIRTFETAMRNTFDVAASRCSSRSRIFR